MLREHGARVVTSDIASYDRAHDEIFDFLYNATAYTGSAATHLYTNPPYGKGNRDAVKFARLALTRALPRSPRVAPG